MSRLRSTLELMGSCFVFSLVVTLLSFVAIFLFTQDFSRVVFYLSLALLLEGGLGLIAGGAVASFSSVVGRVSANLFRSKPWDARRQKEAEKQARSWILTGVFLIGMGLGVSAL